jgi:hypothetical protein
VELKGQVRAFLVYGMPRIVDLVRKPDTIFQFWAHFPMYVGYSGATYIYACCIVGKVRICGKIIFLALGFVKRDFKSA